MITAKLVFRVPLYGVAYPDGETCRRHLRVLRNQKSGQTGLRTVQLIHKRDHSDCHAIREKNLRQMHLTMARINYR